MILLHVPSPNFVVIGRTPQGSRLGLAQKYCLQETSSSDHTELFWWSSSEEWSCQTYVQYGWAAEAEIASSTVLLEVATLRASQQVQCSNKTHILHQHFLVLEVGTWGDIIHHPSLLLINLLASLWFIGGGVCVTHTTKQISIFSKQGAIIALGL